MNGYLWLKALHLLAIIAWFAGLFYLPRLFVYHADTTDTQGYDRFCVMERRLFYGIMTPSAVLTLLAGLGLFHTGGRAYYLQQPWFHWKLLLVCLLFVFHILCGYYLHRFVQHKNKHRALFYRWFNEVPLLPLMGILILVVVKPAI